MTQVQLQARVRAIEKPLAIAALAAGAFAFVYFLTVAIAEAAVLEPINTQLDFGARGNEVTKLQMFLSTDRGIYPEGLVTGYYGALTQKAVAQFQIYHNLPPVGRVGPLTRATINSAIAVSGGVDVRSPIFLSSNVQAGQTNAIVNWTTTEAARGKVYYDVFTVRPNETDRPMMEPLVSGAVIVTPGMAASQSVTLTGLQPSTTYSYVIVSVDAAGNVSITTPATFRTAP